MASSEFSDMAAVGGSESRNEKSQAPPPYAPSYGYDQPGDKPYSGSNPTSYGYNQPGDRDPIPPYGFRQPGYGYGQPVSTSNQTSIVVNSGPSVLVAPVRETGPPPDTTCGLVISILVTFLCGWPCGIGAIVSNRRARTLVDVGQYTQARSALSTMWVWITFSILVGIGAWIYIGFRIKAYLDAENELDNALHNDFYNN